MEGKLLLFAAMIPLAAALASAGEGYLRRRVIREIRREREREQRELFGDRLPCWVCP